MTLKEQLELGDSVIVLPFLERPLLAAVYRRATLVLQPPEQEGFGLPVVEAMACGAVVVASDIPVLREVGGDAAVYCPVANVTAWRETVSKLLCESREQREHWFERRAAGIAQAALQLGGVCQEDGRGVPGSCWVRNADNRVRNYA